MNQVFCCDAFICKHFFWRPLRVSSPPPRACAPAGTTPRAATAASPAAESRRTTTFAPSSTGGSTRPGERGRRARVVAARRLFLPLCQLGAGSRRVPSQRAACAPLSPRDITSLLGLCDAHTPRHSPRSCRPFLPTSPLPPAPSWRVGSARPVASSAPAFAARRVSAPLALPRHHRDIPCVLSDAHHRAAARAHVDLLRRRRRCRPRRRGASTLLALLRARRRPVPRAE